MWTTGSVRGKSANAPLYKNDVKWSKEDADEITREAVNAITANRMAHADRQQGGDR